MDREENTWQILGAQLHGTGTHEGNLTGTWYHLAMMDRRMGNVR